MTVRPRFGLGQPMITRNALSALTHEEVIAALGRHVAGDWGDVDRLGYQANEFGLENHGTLVSAFFSSQAGTRFFVVTDWDRSQTTVLLPGDR